MARGGINKAVVQKARQSLLAKGMYPSIDAVRVELGNTGSKTTISRYLKEIESFDPRPPSSRERMGEELSAMVASLLDRLMEEGDESIEQARSAFDLQRVALEAQIANLQSELTSARRQLDTQQAAIEVQTADLQTTQSSLQAELTRNAGISQRCTDLEALVGDRDKQIQSLEEKHVHARGALEHYRESVKEQRDQDQRRHETQLHESQVEQRKLRESLAVKQDESTRLNRDNERLLGESRQQARTLQAQVDQVQTLTAQVQALSLAEARAGAIIEHHQAKASELNDELKALHISVAQGASRESELAKLVTDLKVQLQSAETACQPPEDSSITVDHTVSQAQDAPVPKGSQTKRKR
ncbi:DNA-binding protein [Pseudomonas sp. NPDC090964]|uniref:DNA-binding protein n=1 Tax=Pseudomonas TaxID=286 RepID=UPI00137268FB|nr:DNA-binding protein [Pseudomonas syringae]NAS95255.1 integrase [Pseudomonas syringae pv. actinidifoliorum]NAT63342.1 integrase [Pseudomonas syringae pv. actinidifoliorum]